MFSHEPILGKWIILFLEADRLDHVDAHGAEYFGVADEAVDDLVCAHLAGDEVSARQEQRLNLRPITPLTHPLFSHSLVVAPQHVNWCRTARAQVNLGIVYTTFDLILRRRGFFGWCGFLYRRTSGAAIVMQLLYYGYAVHATPVGDYCAAPGAADYIGVPVIREAIVGHFRYRHVADSTVSKVYKRVETFRYRPLQLRVTGRSAGAGRCNVSSA